MGVPASIPPCPSAATSSPVGAANTVAPASRACWRPSPSGLRCKAALADAQVAVHAQRVLHALVVPGCQGTGLVAQGFIEAPRANVVGAQLQAKVKGSGHQGTVVQPA